MLKLYKEIKIIVAFAVILLATHTSLLAQSYTILPNDTIIATGQYDVEIDLDISQNNNLPDTLKLSYQKILAQVPIQWDTLICDNHACYGDLKESGNMSILAGDYGYLSLHITPHVNPGTAIIRYAVWETGNLANKDTLTWIVNAGLTGIANASATNDCVIIRDHSLLIKTGTVSNQSLTLFDLQGRPLLQSNITSPVTTIDVSQFPLGFYFVDLGSENSHITSKVFLH